MVLLVRSNFSYFKVELDGVHPNLYCQVITGDGSDNFPGVTQEPCGSPHLPFDPFIALLPDPRWTLTSVVFPRGILHALSFEVPVSGQSSENKDLQGRSSR